MQSPSVRHLSHAVLAAAALLGLGASPIPEAASPRLDVTVQVRKEVVRTDAAGKATTALEHVAQASPGDVLVYTLRAANLGLAPARDARIEDPIPAGTVLLPESVSGRGVHASLDGGKSWQSFPAKVARTRPDGAVEQVPAPADAYTHLRWPLERPLAPGESAEIRFKVRVL